jgi:hypothetical protein
LVHTRNLRLLLTAYPTRRRRCACNSQKMERITKRFRMMLSKIIRERKFKRMLALQTKYSLNVLLSQLQKLKSSHSMLWLQQLRLLKKLHLEQKKL